MNKITTVITPFEVKYPKGFEPEANTPSGLIPSSYLEGNVRHAVIFESTLPEAMRLEKIDGAWHLKETSVF